MTTRLTLIIDVPDEYAGRAEDLLHAIAQGPAYTMRTRIERRPLTPDEEADAVSRVMLADVWRKRP